MKPKFYESLNCQKPLILDLEFENKFIIILGYLLKNIFHHYKV